MNTSYYHGEADRCRRLAAAHPESDSAQRWRQAAAEYEQLAEILDTDRNAPVRRPTTQQQQVQQQQAKAAPDGE